MSKTFWDQIGLVVIAFIWGITFVVVKNNIQDIEPFCYNFIRFSLSALLVFSFILVIRKRELSGLTLAVIRDGCGLGLCLFSGFALLTLGLVHTKASNAGFITGMNVAMVPFFSAIIKRQKPDFFTIVGVIAVSAGLYFLTIKGAVSLNKGDLLIFLGAVAFAFHVIFTETFAQRSSAAILVMIQFCFVGVLSGICAYYMENISIIGDAQMMFSRQMLTGLVIVVLLATCLALLVQTRAQKHVSPAKVALIFSLEPVFATLAGYFWSGETMGTASVTGCVLIFIGMTIVDLPQHIKYIAK